jgi:hypothetical protein
MRRWMMAGGAAMVMLGGTAGAVGPADGANVREPRTSAADARMDARGPAMVTGAPVDALTGDRGDRAGLVTHDELMRLRDELLEQLAREREQKQPAPTFTDAG